MRVFHNIPCQNVGILASPVILLAWLCSPVAADVRASGVTLNEAPILRERVAAGALPPLRERLPEAPAVVRPVERIGRYGGTWRRVHMGMPFSPLIWFVPHVLPFVHVSHDQNCMIQYQG